jgi:hypothetical protein
MRNLLDPQPWRRRLPQAEHRGEADAAFGRASIALADRYQE